MRRNKDSLVDMTPLLDVVFILLFALIFNVNVSQAKSEETIQAQEQEVKALEVDNGGLKAQVEELLSTMTDTALQLTAAESAKKELEVTLEDQRVVMDEKEKMILDLEAVIGVAMTQQMATLKDEDLIEAIRKDLKDAVIYEKWLKYQQIADRYLFVDIHIMNQNGRIYVLDDYTTINIEKVDIENADIKDQKIKDLSGYIFNWLDHKEGGYSFVFVTLSAQDQVPRAVVETVFESLNALQPVFEQDYFLINKYVKYE